MIEKNEYLFNQERMKKQIPRCRSALNRDLSSLILKQQVINNPLLQKKYQHVLDNKKIHFKSRQSKNDLLRHNMENKVKINKLESKVKKLKVKCKTRKFTKQFQRQKLIQEKNQLLLQIMALKQSTKYTRIQQLQASEQEIKAQMIRLITMLKKNIQLTKQSLLQLSQIKHINEQDIDIIRKIFKNKIVSNLRKQNLNMAGIMKIYEGKINSMEFRCKFMYRQKAKMTKQVQTKQKIIQCQNKDIDDLKWSLIEKKSQHQSRGQNIQNLKKTQALIQLNKQIVQLQNIIQQKNKRINQLQIKIHQIKREYQKTLFQHEKQNKNNYQTIKKLKKKLDNLYYSIDNEYQNINKSNQIRKRKIKVNKENISHIADQYNKYFHFMAIPLQTVMDYIKNDSDMISIKEIKKIFLRSPFPKRNELDMQNFCRYLIQDNLQDLIFYDENCENRVDLVRCIFKKVIKPIYIMSLKNQFESIEHISKFFQFQANFLNQKCKDIQNSHFQEFKQVLTFFQSQFTEQMLNYIQGAFIYVSNLNPNNHNIIYQLIQFLKDKQKLKQFAIKKRR